MTAAGKCAGLWLEISGPPKRGGDSVAQRDLMCDASCAGPTARRVVPAGKSPARAGARVYPAELAPWPQVGLARRPRASALFLMGE